jgi:hypothetical protein
VKEVRLRWSLRLSRSRAWSSSEGVVVVGVGGADREFSPELTPPSSDITSSPPTNQDNNNNNINKKQTRNKNAKKRDNNGIGGVGHKSSVRLADEQQQRAPKFEKDTRIQY